MSFPISPISSQLGGGEGEPNWMSAENQGRKDGGEGLCLSLKMQSRIEMHSDGVMHMLQCIIGVLRKYPPPAPQYFESCPE